MKGRLKKGKMAFQDFSFIEFTDDSPLFEITKCMGNYELVADGFGSRKPNEKYGNGPLIVRDINDLELDDKVSRLKRTIINRKKELKDYEDIVEEIKREVQLLEIRLEKIEE